MHTDNTLMRLAAVCADPHLPWKEGQAGASPAFGCLTENVPLELIHAAGFSPVRIQGGHQTALATAHLQSFCCSYSRAALNRGLAGEYSYLRGIISAKTCDVGLGLFDLWTSALAPPFHWLISLPGNSDAVAVDYLRTELGRLQAALEELCQRSIPARAITDSIGLYNQIRTRIARLWAHRDDGRLQLSAEQIAGAIKACSVLPPAEAAALLAYLDADQVPVPASPRRKKVRLLLTGNTYADTSILSLLEGNGGVIVLDDTDSVGRYFGPHVEDGDDPITALARHYTSKLTGCYRLGFEARWQRIEEIISRHRIDGCINLIQKFCESSVFESQLLEESVRRAGIPVLRLEIDDGSPGAGQIKTRAEAFVEMIGDLG